MRSFANIGKSFLGLLILGAALCVGQASAQTGGAPAAPTVSSVDVNGVDLISGRLQVTGIGVSIGSGESSIARSGSSYSFPSDDNYSGYISLDSNENWVVTFGNKSEKFKPTGTTLTFNPIEGATGTLSRAGAIVTYTLKDGTVILLDGQYAASSGSTPDYFAVSSVTKPDGEVITFKYTMTTYHVAGSAETGGGDYTLRDKKTVSSSLGWMIKYSTDANSQRSITAINSSVDYCDPEATSCGSLSQAWPATYWGYGGSYTYTKDLDGHQTTYNGTSGAGFTSIVSSTGVTKSVSYYTSTNKGRVNQVSIGGSTWTYAYSTNGTVLTTTVTNPQGGTRVLTSDTTKQQVLSVQDELGRKVTYTYDATSGFITRITNSDGNSSGGYTTYAYDARGNITQMTLVPKSGSGLANMVTTATYETTCSNPKTCNQPLSVTDANGITTTYTYHASSGNVATKTLPSVGGVAPQIRYSYDQYTPHVKDSTGALVATNPVWRLKSMSTCMSASSCSGTVDELKSSTTYNTTNILPISTSVSRGDDSLMQTTTTTYDNWGNPIVVDGPKSGTADSTYYFYDDLRRLTGTIMPDPDGTGPLNRPALRKTYDTDSHLTADETGTTTGATLAALNAMTVQEKDTNDYSATTGQATVARYYASGTLKRVTQRTYDSLFRLDCEATRLNEAMFTSLPASACTLGTAGAEGSDRIVKYTYDAAGSLLKETEAYGTSLASNRYVKVYNTGNGSVATVADALGNKTTFTYDGFNRLVKACFPSAASGSTSSTTDCEQTGYTAAKPTSVILRDGQTINFSYDALGRVNAKSGALTEAFTYNNFGNVLTHTNNGHTSTYTYNSLGWTLSEANDSVGSILISYAYDAYGKRVKLTYPGSFYVTYEYNDGDQLVAIKENGSTTIASFTGDDYGRRQLLTRGNGVVTTYGYDALSRLTSLTTDASGTTDDLTLGLTYSSADQIKAKSFSNTTYLIYNTSAQNTTYTSNGLNQLTTAGGTTLAYDGRGNMTSDGTVTYTYNVNNLLTSTSSGAVLTYDAENRLYSVARNGTTTRFIYDGADLIAEYDGTNTLLRRYVHGPDDDEPIVWYEGSGTADKRYFTADNQGSIVGITSSTGTSLGSDAYDEYGVPRAGNIGRFQFTGQVYLSEVGLYYYKARFYSPTLGRFMQTDPIGYGDGMNIYAYVHDDPVNDSDPFGLAGKNTCSTDTCKTKQENNGDCPPGDDKCTSQITEIIVTANRERELIKFFISLAPGGDLINCVMFHCSGREWVEAAAWGVLDLAGGGIYKAGTKIALKVGPKVGELAFKAIEHTGFALRKCMCLVAGTEVATPTGLVAIQDIKVGDLVLAYNELNGQVVAKPVTALIRPAPQATFEVKLEAAANQDREVFRASADHPWLMTDGQWVHTQDLKAGQHVKTATDINLVVASLKATGKIEQTYNLTVDDLHTYLIGNYHAIVHNSCWKSVKVFGHTFSAHGERATSKLLGRAGGTRTAQGQWVDNQAAADFLEGVGKLDGPASVKIPDGLGRVINPDGTIEAASRATLVPSSTGLKTAYPIP